MSPLDQSTVEPVETSEGPALDLNDWRIRLQAVASYNFIAICGKG
jgi:hypothetical protein